jgi:uncharacterized protein YndB with AHSA1/START domain
MRWVLLVIAVLMVAAGAVWLVGSRLPVAHTATIQRTIALGPEGVWDTLVNTEAFPSWRSGLASVESLPDRAGRRVWRERSDGEWLTFEVLESSRPSRLVTRIADEGLPFGGTWTWALAPDGAGTTVTLTENGEVYNPLFRFMARYVFGHETTMRTFLDDLERHVGRGQR